LYDV
jgi:hypothetical protein